MPEPLLLLSRADDVATLTFNDAERLNAMTRAMGEAFAAQITELARDESLRALVLTGAGRAFSAGGDLDMIDERARAGRAGRLDENRDSMRAFYALFLTLRELPCPTLAAINGAAVGAGFCVALACDVRIASDTAKLGLNFTALGLHPGMGATWTLPRLVGPAHAAELLYSSRTLSGAEAAAISLVNRAVPRDAVLTTTQELAARFAANAPFANRGVKRALAHSPGASLAEQLDLEAEIQAETFATQDAQEGLAAVRAKRTPQFTGR